MIILEVNGYDDATYVEVSMAEALVLDDVAERVNAAFKRFCQPTMEIYFPDHKDYKDVLEQWEYQNEE